MKILISGAFWLIMVTGNSQSTTWTTEVQSSFIDITGLFGLHEPAQVTTLQYAKKNFIIDGFHSFSWKEPGKVIQTFFGAGYAFKSDSACTKILFLKNDFAFNRVADNGSFLRPMITGKWSTKTRHTFLIVCWVFLDTRHRPVQPLNGGTTYIAHAFSFPYKKIKLRHELRLLFSRINEVRDVGGVVDQVKFSHNKWQLYFSANVGYSFYRSDGINQWVWNVGLGKQF